MAKTHNFDFVRIKKHCRELRKNLTNSETILWKELRNRKLSGFKFLRQHPLLYKGDLTRINYFIADFYCSEKKLVVELDGPIHESNQEYDAFRDSALENIGVKVLHIKNEELTDISKVLQKIRSLLVS